MQEAEGGGSSSLHMRHLGMGCTIGPCNVYGSLGARAQLPAIGRQPRAFLLSRAVQECYAATMGDLNGLYADSTRAPACTNLHDVTTVSCSKDGIGWLQHNPALSSVDQGASFRLTNVMASTSMRGRATRPAGGTPARLHNQPGSQACRAAPAPVACGLAV